MLTYNYDGEQLFCTFAIVQQHFNYLVFNLPSATFGVECGEMRFRFRFSDGEQLSPWAAVFTEVEFVFSPIVESWSLSENSIPMLASVLHSSNAIVITNNNSFCEKYQYNP